MSLRLSRPAVIALSVLALVLLAGAWSAYWHWSAARLEAAIEGWVAQQRARGLDLSYRGPAIGGFPFDLRATFEQPSASSPEGWHWQGPTVEASAPLWNPFVIEADFAGRHQVTLEAGPDRTLRVTEIRAEAATARVELERDGAVERAEADLKGLTIQPPAGGPLSAASLSGAFEPLPEDQEGLARRALLLELEDGTLPPEVKTPLGPSIQSGRLDAILVGDIPPGEPRAALIEWRQSGGRLEVAEVKADWGPLRLAGDGTAALDEQLRPQGAFTARLSGLLETVDAFLRAGWISFGQAVGIRMGVLALAGQDQGESEEGAQKEPVVTVPITLQDGRLYLGPVELFRLYPVL